MATIMRGMAGRRTEHLFFAAMAVLLIFYVLLGFWPSYIGAGLILAPLPSLLVHVHGALFVGWIALFLAQTMLAGSGRTALHRRLGPLMGGWAVAMVLVGPLTVVMALRRHAPGIDSSVLAGDLGQTIAFVILIVNGFARRRQAATHKRLMLLASAAIIGPAIARWPFAFIERGPPVGLALFYLLPALLLAGYDLATMRRLHRATLLGLTLAICVLVSFVALPAVSGWRALSSAIAQS